MISLLEAFKSIAQLYKVPRKDKKKIKMINPSSGRMKTFKRVHHHTTAIAPEKRTLRNCPPNVRFQEWLGIDSQKLDGGSVNCWGWGVDGKVYGWSHRAVRGFYIGEKIGKSTTGNQTGEAFTIKTKEQAEEMAQNFAKEVGG